MSLGYSGGYSTAERVKPSLATHSALLGADSAAPVLVRREPC